MFREMWRVAVVVAVVMVVWGTGRAFSQGKKDVPPSFSGRLMEYTARKGVITQITVLQPTPRGKVLQEIYDLRVTAGTKFIVKDGDTTTELDAKSVLTDAKTKEMLVQKPGSTLGNNSGIAVEVQTKGGAATTITFNFKKKK